MIIIREEYSRIEFAKSFVLNTKTIFRELPGSFVMPTDFEAGLLLIQILSERCSGCGACYGSKNARKPKRNDGEVLHKPFRNF